ncbi:transposase [Bradyrhizobium sp. SZCCHNRI2009]|uniref:transposase n=1 Tax=unclassified Bradyrhizobium TaxID=2631580 RepID=UPI00396761CF
MLSRSRCVGSKCSRAEVGAVAGATKTRPGFVAETVGEPVCAVARRHGLLPQQVFGWRRQLRDAADSRGSEVEFVPAVIAAGTSASDRQRSAAS